MEIDSSSTKQQSTSNKDNKSPKPFEMLQPEVRSHSAISGVSSSSQSNEAGVLNLFLSNEILCDNYLEQSYILEKRLCIEQIKKPGNEYSGVFQRINNSPLTVKMRMFLVKELVYEASRFKRTKLIKLLNTYHSLLSQLSIQINEHKSNSNSTKQ